MNSLDGTRIVGIGETMQITRWEELSDTVRYHSKLADLIKSPISFRLLNHNYVDSVSPVFSAGQHYNDVQRAEDTMRRCQPHGNTPLTQHILEIRHRIETMAPSLRENGQHVVLVLATDGLPTDDAGDASPDERDRLTRALRSLEDLQVWLVVRLCTGDEVVKAFYNALDAQVNLPIEVVDDVEGEAGEVYRHNPWANYCFPLHRAREFGFRSEVLDLLDERPLDHRELGEFCALLFGEEMEGHDPTRDWHGFSEKVARLVKREKLLYDPMKEEKRPWINVMKMNRHYGSFGSHLVTSLPDEIKGKIPTNVTKKLSKLSFSPAVTKKIYSVERKVAKTVKKHNRRVSTP